MCSSFNVEPFLFIDKVTTTQHLMYNTREEALAAPTAELDLLLCESCSLIFNQAFSEDKTRYSSDYDNSQNHSSAFSLYVDDQIKWLMENYIHTGDTIVEVGCGKGYYIRELLEKASAISVRGGYGFDTSYVGDERVESVNLTFFRDYYGDIYKHIKPNLVIIRHVIEHISKPFEFLTNIHYLANEGALVFLETPDLDWILKNNVIFDFFYEHCSYYNHHSIKKLLSESGFDILEIRNGFDDQYMWVIAQKRKTIKRIETNTVDQSITRSYRDYPINRSSIMQLIRKKLEDDFRKKIKVALWGAGAKGVTFANMFDQHNELINCLIDINSFKQNKYIANSGHKVISPSEIIKYGIEKILIMNPNYVEEIKSELRRNSCADIAIDVV